MGQGAGQLSHTPGMTRAIAYGKKEKGYLEGSNMDMGMDNYGIGVYGD